MLGIVKRIMYLDVPGEDLFGREISTNTQFALLTNAFVMSPIHSHNVRWSSALLIAADMSASDRLAVRMMTVLLADIASKDQTLTMIIIDGISFSTDDKRGVCYRTYGGICITCCDVNSPDGSSVSLDGRS